ncbi:hypothetical protein MRB53_029408 [Persea americana]|uniref:Uncharacterized protein n=1 Tax=Persea americana TaxID=3435 RepID=A0ACC2KIU6_PERAE|nr:hypothetical protein MRB53_029408 [Persea americana]
MGWFPCSGKPNKKSKKKHRDDDGGGEMGPPPPEKLKLYPSMDVKEGSKERSGHIAAQTFTFRELAAATKNFRPDCLLGEGGFGRVYKGRLESTNQVG